MKSILSSSLLAGSLLSGTVASANQNSTDDSVQKPMSQSILANSTLEPPKFQPTPPSYEALQSYPPSVDIVIDTRKKAVLKLVIPEIESEPLIDSLSSFPRATFLQNYKPIRSISFAVSDNVRFLIGNSRQPVQIGLVITLDEREKSLSQIGIGRRKDFTGIIYQMRF